MLDMNYDVARKTKLLGRRNRLQPLDLMYILGALHDEKCRVVEIRKIDSNDALRAL